MINDDDDDDDDESDGAGNHTKLTGYLLQILSMAAKIFHLESILRYTAAVHAYP